MTTDPVITVSPAGKTKLAMPQAIWQDAGAGFESARFAGEEMFLRAEQTPAGETFRLAYLCFEASGFVSLGAAKAYAPQFAQHVLHRMAVWAEHNYEGDV
ncbi:hypothetical protein [Cupriavidus pampae]|jgi:hypothetical protein|uniref:Uncharacterized protein n=1 Tax=Cupriavidus pampae TaxID=659251 RepID=A0ABM8XU50_9BURK|nr:hypothetical protein [Cupriavidus pampae]CAG9183884.1 hypothetical protein LMG32289_05453 [Cupriavidus pampae]